LAILYSEGEKAVSKRQLYSVSELAPEFGLDRRTLANRLRDTDSDGLVSGHPAYHLGTVIQAVYGGESSVRKEIDRERLRALQDERKIREREFVPEAEVAKRWFHIVGMIRTALLGLPRKLPAQVLRLRTEAEAESLLRKEIYVVLNKLAAMGPEYVSQHQQEEKENEQQGA
jgi:hypothetical protein